MNKFEQIGFTDLDLFVLLTCLIGGTLGALVDYFFKRESFLSIPKKNLPAPNFLIWFPWMFGRLIIGCFSGGVIWLLLAGGMKIDTANFCRLMLMSIGAGLSFPALIARHRGNVEKTILTQIN